MGEQRPDPFGGPRPFVGAVDVAKWLEGDGPAAPHIVGAIFAAQPASMMRAAHREHSGARRVSLVEDIDLGIRVAPELHGEQRQQHRLARDGRPGEWKSVVSGKSVYVSVQIGGRRILKKKKK